VTAASPGIADALADRYRIPRPTPIYNVFPWADRAGIDGDRKDRRGPALSLCWYSQSIGLDRGLQDAIRAAGLLRGDFQLHFRGTLEPSVSRELLRVARECGVAERLHLHPQVPPGELLSRVVEHDVGLALEQPVSFNRLATVTNKVFLYLLAGLAVAATDTPGHRAVLNTCPEACLVYPPGDHAALAAGLQRWLDSPQLLQRARRAALEAARTRWNWETESRRLVELVAGVLHGPSQTSAAASALTVQQCESS
jgi:glycosyltransferase involved in cell wall biosynthesis